MTLAELMAAGLTEEMAKKALEMHTTELTKKLGDETAGLTKNRDEILGEKKKLQDALKLFEGLDPEKAKEALKKMAAAEKKGMLDKGEYDKLNEASNAEWQAKLDAATARGDKAHNFLNTSEVDRQLTSELIEIGIKNPVLLKAAKAMLKEGIEVVENDGKYNVLKDGKTLKQSIIEYAATDEAKQFISAAPNTGGDSKGNSGGVAPANVQAKINELMAAGKHTEADALLRQQQLINTYNPTARTQ